MGVYPSVETNYIGEAAKNAAFFSLGERLVRKQPTHLTSLWRIALPFGLWFRWCNDRSLLSYSYSHSTTKKDLYIKKTL